MKSLLLSVLMLCFIMAQEAVDLNMINRIKTEGLNKSKVMDFAFYMTDVNGPRLTGSVGLKSAQEWVKKEIESWGVKSVKLESWGTFGKSWRTKAYHLSLSTPYFENFIAYPKAWTKSTNGAVTGKPILMEISKEEDFEKYKGQIAGKIVIMKASRVFSFSKEADAKRFTEDELDELEKQMAESQGGRNYEIPSWLQSYSTEINGLFMQRRVMNRKIAEFLLKEGASLILSMSRSGNHGTSFTSNGAQFKIGAPDGIAEFEVAPEHFMKMIRLLDKKIEFSVTGSMDNDMTVTADSTQFNIIAEIPGLGNLKDEVVMLGGHFDSWHAATGATDNAAGSAVMMEAFRILNTLGLNEKNRRTIRLALWSGEEQGLFGSIGYVKKNVAGLSADKKSWVLKEGHENISAYYNLDNGSGKIRGIYTENNSAVVPIFEEYLKPFNAYGASTITLSPTGGTDHMAFDGVGVPGFQFIQDPLEYDSRTHHSNMDTYDRLSADDLKQAATIIASFVYQTAVRKDKIPRKNMPDASAVGRFF